MAEPLPRKVVHPEEWIWKSDKDPPFHRTEFSDVLVKHYEKLVPEGKIGRIFFPLCGKTKDMIYCADKGLEVVGLEFSEVGIECFFKENSLTYEKTTLKDAPFNVYKAKERNITIFSGDLFKLKPEIVGKFDYFFDRGSYVAINVSTQQPYSDLMFDLMKPTAKILMEAVFYDASLYPGPPHSITRENLESTFGRKCNIQSLEVIIMEALSVLNFNGNLDIHVYLISFK